jgi:hypothetical protein
MSWRGFVDNKDLNPRMSYNSQGCQSQSPVSRIHTIENGHSLCPVVVVFGYPAVPILRRHSLSTFPESGCLCCDLTFCSQPTFPSVGDFGPPSRSRLLGRRLRPATSVHPFGDNFLYASLRGSVLSVTRISLRGRFSTAGQSVNSAFCVADSLLSRIFRAAQGGIACEPRHGLSSPERRSYFRCRSD